MFTPKSFLGDDAAFTNAPLSEEIIDLRKKMKLSQQQAANMLQVCRNVYMSWESGKQRMHPAIFELFQLKASNCSMAPNAEHQELPDRTKVAKLRKSVGLSKEDAARMVHSCLKTYLKWDKGSRVMHPAIFELFQIRIDQYRRENPDAKPEEEKITDRVRRLTRRIMAEENARRIASSVRPDPLLSLVEGTPKDVIKWIHRAGATQGRYIPGVLHS